MSKFKITLKLQGLELEIEGSKDDIPHLSKNVANQLAGLIAPAAATASIGAEHEQQIRTINPGGGEPLKKPRRKKANSNKTISPSGDRHSNSIDWVHDPEKWGSPQQTWNTADKSIWLLYVVEKEQHLTELSQPEITSTFNKHFKQAGILKPSNVSRDLGKKKSGTKDAPALVGENTTKSPSTWFLTDAGKKHAEKLISEK